jgi:uncharacterized protein YtpQ (UPF0354 family)
MFWRRKKPFTSKAIAYLKASLPHDGTPVADLPPEAIPVVSPYSEDLLICYLVDQGSHYEYVQQCHIDIDGIDRDELHQIGLRNLRELVALRQARVQPYQGIFAFLMRGDFESSVILLDDLWDKDFRQFVAGEYAIAIPARDILAFCDNSSAEGIAELTRLVARIQPIGDHLLTEKLHVRRNGSWVPREP